MQRDDLHGLSSKAACELVWKDIIWETEECDFLQIAIRKKATTSNVQNYTIPCTDFEASVLRKRFDFVRDQNRKRKDFGKLCVASKAEEYQEKYNSKDLNAFIKKLLISIGIPAEKLTSDARNRSALGVELLHSDRALRLKTICGAEESILRFLTYQPIFKTTPSSYNSCTTEFSQNRLYSLLQRGDCSKPDQDNLEPNQIVQKENDMTKILVPAGGSKQISILKIDATMYEGESLTFPDMGSKMSFLTMVRELDEDGNVIRLEN